MQWSKKKGAMWNFSLHFKGAWFFPPSSLFFFVSFFSSTHWAETPVDPIYFPPFFFCFISIWSSSHTLLDSIQFFFIFIIIYYYYCYVFIYLSIFSLLSHLSSYLLQPLHLLPILSPPITPLNLKTTGPIIIIFFFLLSFFFSSLCRHCQWCDTGSIFGALPSSFHFSSSHFFFILFISLFYFILFCFCF